MWSYDVTLLGSSARTVVRLTIGDTTESLPLLQDEEIDYFLSVNGGSVAGASQAAVRAILAKFATMPSRQRAGLTEVEWSDLLARLTAVMEELDEQVAGTVVPFAGGTSIQDITTRDANADIPKRAFDEDGPGDFGGTSVT